jgi:hypothetical protein
LRWLKLGHFFLPLLSASLKLKIRKRPTTLRLGLTGPTYSDTNSVTYLNSN